MALSSGGLINSLPPPCLPQCLTFRWKEGSDKHLVLFGPTLEEVKVLKGLLAGGVTMGVAAVFPEALVFPLFAAVLGLVAGVGPGMAMADPLTSSGRQWAVALGIVAVGIVGLWVSYLLLAGAWVALGLWTLLLPKTITLDAVPDGYPGFVCSYSLVSASFVAYMWAAVGL
jgi:hypothetical protein